MNDYKKKIGVSFSTVKLHNYYSWFTRLGLENEVELIDLSFQKNNQHDFELCDGFLLTGGDDIDPSFYGGTSVYANMPASFHLHRDVFEQLMFEYAMQQNKPVLGICRGLQLVNVILGGRLIQDLGDAGNKDHMSEGGIDKTNSVAVNEGTLLHTLHASTGGYVNSAHHQAIDPQKVGKNLLVNAWAQENEKVIEGVEFEDKQGKPFMLCVQWHPERMPETESTLSKNLLNGFLQAIPT